MMDVYRFLIVWVTVLVSLIHVVPARCQQPPSRATQSAGKVDESTKQDVENQAETSVRPGINEKFLNKDLDVSEWLGRFEIESREVYAQRESVLRECAITPGSAVADVGAGTGFYSVDIAPRFLRHISEQSRKDGVRNLKTILCSDRSVRLPVNSVDLVFVCDVYHHFEYPRSTLNSIHDALRDGGTFIVIDFERIPGKSREFILNHVRAGKTDFRAEIEAAGFVFEKEVAVSGFDENYLLRFRKRAADESESENPDR
jgi:SAM-dependent methyltransferase